MRLPYSILILFSYYQIVVLEKIRPKISLNEINKKTWSTMEIFGDSETDLDVILDETKVLGKRLELNCKAPYPVVWVYKGDGIPNLQVTTGVNTVHSLFVESKEFDSTGTIGFSRDPSEADTGNYTCHSVENWDVFTSYYLYIAGEKLFVQTKQQTVIYTEGDTILRIPCSVSHPDVKLSLQRLTNGMAEFPLNASVSYDPKFGFLLYIPDFTDVEGTYLCNAAFQGSNSSETINVIKHNTISACTDGNCLNCPPSTKCGENSSCKVFKGKPKCHCLPGFTGNPVYGCTDIRQFDNCARICGTNTDCNYNTDYKETRCLCLPGYVGDPYFECHLASSPPPNISNQTTYF